MIRDWANPNMIDPGKDISIDCLMLDQPILIRAKFGFNIVNSRISASNFPLSGGLRANLQQGTMGGNLIGILPFLANRHRSCEDCAFIDKLNHCGPAHRSMA